MNIIHQVRRNPVHIPQTYMFKLDAILVICDRFNFLKLLGGYRPPVPFGSTVSVYTFHSYVILN